MVFGFALAFVSMIFFGLYMVPRKFCGLRHLEFVLSMSGGVLASMLVAWALYGDKSRSAPLAAYGWAALCGPIWTLGMVAFTVAVAEMGLTLATPIKNTTAVLGSLVGLLFFGESRHTTPWMALGGSVLIVACAVVIGQAGEGSETHFGVTRRGVIWSLLAAVFFAAYTVPLKLAMGLRLDSYSIVLGMAVGIGLAAAAGHVAGGGSPREWWRRPRRDHYFAALAGVTWSLATLFMNEAIRRIGLAVTWPVTNLNTVVAVGMGAWVFHEVHLERHRTKLAWGLVFAAAGVALLGLSKR